VRDEIGTEDELQGLEGTVYFFLPALFAAQ
jgi:hypothetical protein